MIRPIDIRLNAAHPELPLVEATTFTGAPSSVFIRGVPRAVGNWSITAVNVAVTYPDNSTTTRAAVQSAENVWVATIPGTATSGRTEAGFRVLADGIDENGEAVTGYILGVADFAVASLDVTPAPQPGETSYQMLYFDAVPGVLRKGDVTKVDGVLKFYNGEAWEAFATPPTLDDAVTRTSENGVKSSGIWSAIWGALTALPTGFSSLYDWCVSQLAGKASTADATLTERGFSAWSMTPATMPGGDAYPQPELVDLGEGNWQWKLQTTAGLVDENEEPGTKAAKEAKTSLAFQWAEYVTATRTALPGYQLGSQSNKPVASEAEAEALRTAVTGKQDALSAQQLANIADVPNKANAADLPYSFNAATVTPGSSEVWTANYSQVYNRYGELVDVEMPPFWSTESTPDGNKTGWFWINPDMVYELLSEDESATSLTAYWDGYDGEEYISYTINFSKTATPATVTNVLNRAINYATLGSTVTAATVTLPAATTGRARDFFIDLTIEATTAPTLTFIDPATSTTINVAFGADSLADIDTGKNAVLFTEFPNHTWLVSVKHEEAAS